MEKAKRRSAAFKVENETQYPTREVGNIVRWVMKYLDLTESRTLVRVKHHNRKHAYSGRFFINARNHVGHVYREAYTGAGYGEYVEVRPKVPSGISHLITIKIGKPGVYPVMTHVYDRKDVPEPWLVENWQEALVSVMAHEAMHIRQRSVGRAGSRYNESQTEWAAFRLWREWKEMQAKKAARRPL